MQPLIPSLCVLVYAQSLSPISLSCINSTHLNTLHDSHFYCFSLRGKQKFGRTSLIVFSFFIWLLLFQSIFVLAVPCYLPSSSSIANKLFSPLLFLPLLLLLFFSLHSIPFHFYFLFLLNLLFFISSSSF